MFAGSVPRYLEATLAVAPGRHIITTTRAAESFTIQSRDIARIIDYFTL